ncbi:MAG: hypothetical protein BWY09_00517 [Candidatus Hydrogenedentes bacterium ADurb.Bin179]|nr:MAG: hypothetical protein BWY09_00517 [Candidatus Hydrogenedentes bacterium ADurb.Bin179]
MINVIKVRCPHCGIEGQLLLPEMDAIIVGPCPECNKSVLIFSGKALPLDTEVMANGNREEIYRHLFTVLRKFVRERLDLVFDGEPSETGSAGRGMTGEHLEPQRKQGPEPDGKQAPVQETRPSISAKEVKEFLNKELPLLDNTHYFKSIFG